MQRFEEPNAAREPQFGHPWYKQTVYCLSVIFKECDRSHSVNFKYFNKERRFLWDFFA